MVFSRSSLKTRSILKVVELDRLKPGKNQQVNGSTGVVADGISEATPSSPVVTTSFSEEYLKTEPHYDSTMFHESDSEFFQDLVQWCSTPVKEEQVQTIDTKPSNRAYTIDTPNTQISPQGWDGFDSNSPYAQADFYNTTPVDSLSPNVEAFTFENELMGLPDVNKESKNEFQEQFLDISSLPVVIEEFVSERVQDAGTWPAMDQVGWTADTLNTNNTKTCNSHTMPFINQEENPDLRYGSIIPREMDNNDVVISEYIVRDGVNNWEGTHEARTGVQRQAMGLSVDVAARAINWPGDIISTPEVLSYVEQLEKEKSTHMKPKQQSVVQDTSLGSMESSHNWEVPSPIEYEPITPKSESHFESDPDELKPRSSKRKQQDSEDSDETYTPYSEQTPTRKYKKRKPNVPIKDMIIALEGSQQLTKARRGRPPKRRDSTVSSVCSVDDNSSCMSNHEGKYRELRDKNNEASKRSRMNRKLKELQMEQLAVDLEERNKKLKVKADILEDMTKRLKDALMTAILQK